MCPTPLAAQVAGVVKDKSGEPIVGANVLWAGSSVGTVTDAEGRFELREITKTNKLVFGYAGYEADTLVVVNPQSPIEVVLKERELDEVEVVAKRMGLITSRDLLNAQTITSAELVRAACCNLGESFTTNPSVDVNYSDAATGAKQIKLLGLSGSYVQMLTENIPNYRGAAMPYALGYVPGPWMHSIQVSKGSSSVKNGYESMTGQINVEFKKPQDVEALNVNVYGDSKSKIEANADANIHLNNRLSTGLLLHYENAWGNHDDNGDGFLDKPKVRQYNIQNRWAWFGDRYIFQASAKVLSEKRESGQSEHGQASGMHQELFKINLNTDRYEAFLKNAYIIDKQRNASVALILSGSLHELDASYGYKAYDVTQQNLYASLLYESDFTKKHNLSAGFSLNYDNYGQDYRIANDKNGVLEKNDERETVPGAYVQYTFNLGDRFVAMGGIRIDHSNLFGTFVTPRAHIKYAPNEVFSFRLSAGKGYRAVHALAENNYLLASGRRLVIGSPVQEAAWNYGISTALYIPLFGKTMNVNAEYYYTDFDRQCVVDYDTDHREISLVALQGKSYSHTFQVDVSYPLFAGMSFTAAYRLNDVKTTYGGKLLERPLTSRYKGLATASYQTPLGLWQFDVTFQMNGGGRMPAPYALGNGAWSWQERFPAFGQLNAQVTRWFRHWSIYVGGENLTGYKQKNPIIGANDPWNERFDPTLVWGPVHGTMFYAGIRVNFEKRKKL